MRERIVKRIVGHFVFQLQNALAGAQARFQFFRVAGLRHIVVGSRFKALTMSYFGCFRCE